MTMEYNPLLAPVVTLVAWTLLVMLWMAMSRFQAFRHHSIDPGKVPGGRGADLEGRVEPRFQWPAHNYTHLLEQPTIFYAIVFALVLMGDRQPLNLWLAWSYVGLRVVHSVWQIYVNRVPVRFILFLMSSLCLIGLVLHAMVAILA